MQFWGKIQPMIVALKFFIAMSLSFISGLLGLVFSPQRNYDAWYQVLAKSELTPDPLIFTIIFVILHAFLGMALFLVFDEDKPFRNKTNAIMLFMLQMVLTALFNYLFFGLHNVTLSLIVIAVLIMVMLFMFREFLSIKKYAGWLVLPYIIWLLFALYLNGVIIYLN